MVDDRIRTLAAVFLLQQRRPDFLAIHLVDLDAEEHDTAPFSAESKAILKYGAAAKTEVRVADGSRRGDHKKSMLTIAAQT
jgi:hypothetical protein